MFDDDVIGRQEDSMETERGRGVVKTKTTTWGYEMRFINWSYPVCHIVDAGIPGVLAMQIVVVYGPHERECSQEASLPHLLFLSWFVVSVKLNLYVENISSSIALYPSGRIINIIEIYELLQRSSYYRLFKHFIICINNKVVTLYCTSYKKVVHVFRRILLMKMFVQLLMWYVLYV